MIKTKNTKAKADSLVDRIANDPDLYRSFKDNIAMSFKDQYDRTAKKKGTRQMNREDIHDIANQAADNFLKLWLAK